MGWLKRPADAIHYMQCVATEASENTTCDMESCDGCPLCCNVLDKPLELSCGEVVTCFLLLQVGATLLRMHATVC